MDIMTGWTALCVFTLHLLAACAIMCSDDKDVRFSSLMAAVVGWMIFGPAVGHLFGWW